MDPQLDAILNENTEAVTLLQKIVTLIEGVQGKGKGKEEGEEKEGGGSAGIGQIASRILALVAVITGLVFAADNFVKALNPALAAQFGQELKNLQATIGDALTPIIANAIPVIRQLSGIFLELGKELRPIINDLSDAIGAILVSTVRAAAAQFKVVLIVLGPLIGLITMLTNQTAQLTDVMVAAAIAVVAMITELLNITGIGDALNDFKHWLAEMAHAMAYAAAKLLMLGGAGDFLAKFKANLAKIIDDKKNPKGGLLAAPTSSSVSGIEDIAKRFAEKAFIAGAGGPAKKPEVELLESILAGINDAEADKFGGLEDLIVSAVKKALGGEEALKPARAALETIGDASATTGDRFRAGRAAGGLFGGVAAVGGGFVTDIENFF